MNYSYLASPYAHEDEEMCFLRYEAATRALAYRLRLGLPTYAPIVHNHRVARLYNLPRTWDFWKQHDLPILFHAADLVILTLQGWRESTGVNAERAFAEAHSLPISYLDPGDIPK